jgi:hypothetical protein
MTSPRFTIRFGLRLTSIVLMICYAAIASAMDWDTAAEVATCRNRTGYQELAARAADLLSKHEIHSMLMYFAKPDKDGIEMLLTDPKQAGRWGLYVHVRDARQARRLMASAIKDGLHVTLSTKDPDPTPEVGATPN